MPSVAGEGSGLLYDVSRLTLHAYSCSPSLCLADGTGVARKVDVARAFEAMRRGKVHASAVAGPVAM